MSRRWPPGTVRGRLLGLLVLATLPMFLLAAIGVDAYWRVTLREAQSGIALERDHAVGLNRAAIGTSQALLATLSLAMPQEPQRCAEWLTPAEGLGLQPLVLDAAGQVICGSNTGSALARMAATLNPAPFIGAGAGASVVIAQPLPDGGMVLTELPIRVPRAEATLWLIPAEGLPRAVGSVTAAPPALPAGREAALARSPDGTAWLAASGPIAPGLDLLLARPEAPLRQAALQAALYRLAEIAAILLLGGAAVFLGAGHAVTRPLARLRAAVGRWRAGAPLEIGEERDLPEELRELAEAFRQGAEEIAARDTALEAAVARAELLAEEVHHRVKNNLQIVSSLLALQAGRIADPAARLEFEATRDRVAALATLHRHMYVHHDPEAIDLRTLLIELGEQLFAAGGERPGRRICYEVTAAPLRIASDQAVPLTLLITEAVSASLKQGFPGARRGRIAIRLSGSAGRAHLAIEDDGAWPRAEDRLRASLMRGFARQLGGELQVAPCRLELDIPLRPPLPRERLRARADSPSGS